MAKAEMDMIRDILRWPVSDEQKLALIRQVAGEQAAPVPAPVKVVKKRKSSASGQKAPATPAAPSSGPN